MRKPPPTAISIQKKGRKTLATEATNLSYCQCEHISTQVDDKSAVTAIKQCPHLPYFLKKKKSTPYCSVIIIPTQKCTITGLQA